MSLWIGGSQASRDRVIRWLQQICWRVRLNADGTISRVAGPSVSGAKETGCACLEQLISSPRMVNIYPLKSKWMKPPGGLPLVLYGGACTRRPPMGGVVQPDGSPGTGPDGQPGNDTSVYIDESNNGGKGYVDYDRQGNPSPSPMWLKLAHELTSGHALQFVTGTAPQDKKGRENLAIQSENSHRAEHELPSRSLKR